MTNRVISIISRMNIGGPAVLLVELINSLPSSEFEHLLITGRCEANEKDYLDVSPLNSDFEYLDGLGRSVSLTNDVFSFLKMIKVIRRYKPNIVHTHTSKAGVLGRVATKIAAPRAKIVHTYHGHLLYGYFGGFKRSVIIFLEKVLSRITDVLLAVSTPVMNDLKSVGIGNEAFWQIIHPGVPIPEDHKRVVGSKETISLIWIGRFTEIKNPQLAIQAFADLKRITSQKVTLTMIGDGELFQECTAFTSQEELDIYFLGWQPEVLDYLQESDLLLMTSLNEGMPVVILEAAMMGIPCLSTEVGGISDFIAEGDTGFFSSAEPNKFAEKISKLIEDQDLRLQVGLRAKQLAHSGFSSATYLNSHINLYRNFFK